MKMKIINKNYLMKQKQMIWIKQLIINHFGSRIYYKINGTSAIKVKELELADFIYKLLKRLK